MIVMLKKDAKKEKREDGDPGTEITKEDIEEALDGNPEDMKELNKILSKGGFMLRSRTRIRKPRKDSTSRARGAIPVLTGTRNSLPR